MWWSTMDNDRMGTLGVLIAALKMIEYRYLVLEHSLEIYGGLVALLFSALGIWLGLLSLIHI